MTEKLEEIFSPFLNYFGFNSNKNITQNSEIPAYPTPTLISPTKGRQVFGLNNSISLNNCDTFYSNILPFKVKEIMSAGWTQCICYWTTDDKLLFSGFYFLKENKSNYLFKYNLTKEQKYINENMIELFEFKWKDFIKNKLKKINNCNSINIKQVYFLGNYLIIELDNNILFYYYLKKYTYNTLFSFSLKTNFYGIIPINNVKWIKGGVMSKKVYIYTNANELYTFKEETLEKEKFLQRGNNKLIRLAATTGQRIDALVTEDNKIYFKSEQNSNYGIVIPNNRTTFGYHKTSFEKESKIIDIKGGFCHFVVLLENKKVYSIGYNNSGQLGEDQTVVEKTFEFKQIVLKTRENILVDKIYASSCGTILRTANEFIFLGEAIEGFTMKNMIPNIQNSYILKREEASGCKWNEICCGHHSYLIYYKENTKRDIDYFLQNLMNSFNFEKNLTHDIEITTFAKK